MNRRGQAPGVVALLVGVFLCAAATSWAADPLIEAAIAPYVGEWDVAATSIDERGRVTRKTLVERLVRTGDAAFEAQVFEGKKRVWTSRWTLERAGGPDRLRLAERWPDGTVVRYEGTMRGGILDARGRQPNGREVWFRYQLVGGTFLYYREDSLGGRVVGVEHEVLTRRR